MDITHDDPTAAHARALRLAGAASGDRRTWAAFAGAFCRSRIAPLLFALGGCSSSPDIAVVAPAIPAGKAQLTINRTSGFEGALTKANVDVNGQRLGDFGKEDGYTTFVAPGRTTVSASAATPPGRYMISFNAAAGKVYRLQITTRPEGYLPAETSGPFPYQLVENEGAFKIQPVD